METEHRDPEKAELMVTAQDALFVRVDVEAFTQGLQVANLQTFGIELQDAVKPCVAEALPARYEMKTPIATVLWSKDDGRIAAWKREYDFDAG